MVVKTASGVAQWFLKTFNYGAITMPWQTVYVRQDLVGVSALVEHEKVHCEQIQRLGAITWTFLIVYYLVRYGYQNSPLEKEARERSGW